MTDLLRLKICFTALKSPFFIVWFYSLYVWAFLCCAVPARCLGSFVKILWNLFKRIQNSGNGIMYHTSTVPYTHLLRKYWTFLFMENCHRTLFAYPVWYWMVLCYRAVSLTCATGVLPRVHNAGVYRTFVRRNCCGHSSWKVLVRTSFYFLVQPGGS